MAKMRVLILVFLFSVLAHAVYAQIPSQGWTDQIIQQSGSAGYKETNVYKDSHGRMHALWILDESTYVSHLFDTVIGSGAVREIAPSGTLGNVFVLSDPLGGRWVTWSDSPIPESTVYLQKLDDEGVPQFAQPVMISRSNVAYMTPGSMVLDPNSNLYVYWSGCTERVGCPANIYVTKVLPSGTIEFTRQLTTVGNVVKPSALRKSDGTFLVVYAYINQPYNIYLLHVDANGFPLSQPILIMDRMTVWGPLRTALGPDNFLYIGWGAGAAYAVYLAKVNQDTGEVISSSPVSTIGRRVSHAQMSIDAYGYLHLLYSEGETYDLGHSVIHQKFSISGATPQQISRNVLWQNPPMVLPSTTGLFYDGKVHAAFGIRNELYVRELHYMKSEPWNQLSFVRGQPISLRFGNPSLAGEQVFAALSFSASNGILLPDGRHFPLDLDALLLLSLQSGQLNNNGETTIQLFTIPPDAPSQLRIYFAYLTIAANGNIGYISPAYAGQIQ